MVAVESKPSTSALIVCAARGVLQRDGLDALTIRAVATEAGVNLALIHYHFHSRDGLLLATLEHLNGELLTRQRGLYGRWDMTLADIGVRRSPTITRTWTRAMCGSCWSWPPTVTPTRRWPSTYAPPCAAGRICCTR